MMLCNAISGNGAFRRFKDIIERYDIENQWYDYRDKSLKKLAVDWCNENNIQIQY